MKLRKRIELRGEGEAFCPLCRVRLGAPDDGERPCEGCGTRMHLDCAHELGGCPTLGCERKGIAPDDEGVPLPFASPGLGPAGEPRENLVDEALAGLRERMREDDPDYEPPSEEELEEIRQRLARLHERRWRNPEVGLSQIIVGDAEGPDGSCLALGIGMVCFAGGVATAGEQPEVSMGYLIGGTLCLLVYTVIWWRGRDG